MINSINFTGSNHRARILRSKTQTTNDAFLKKPSIVDGGVYGTRHVKILPYKDNVSPIGDFLSLKLTRPKFFKRHSDEIIPWLQQFENKEDKLTAVKILKNFTYVDIENARKAYRKLYLDLVKGGLDPEKTNFATIGNAKSSSMMSYLFRQANKMRYKGTVVHENTDTTNLPKRDKFICYKDLNDVDLNREYKEQGIENLVIIDDMIGDGDSLIEFLNDKVQESMSQYKNVYYVTLIKDPDGERKVKEHFPELNIEFLSAQEIHKYDSPENTDFSEEEKEEIKQFIEKYSKKIAPELVQKYSRSKLFLSFDWNCPGNCPMLFNITNDKWSGLFMRYNGLEEKGAGANFDFRC